MTAAAPTDRNGDVFRVGELYVCTTDDRVYECVDIIDGSEAGERLRMQSFAGDDAPVVLFKDAAGFSPHLMAHTRWLHDRGNERYVPVADALIGSALGG